MTINFKRIISVLAVASVICTTAYAKIDENTVIGGKEFLYSSNTAKNAKLSITVLKHKTTLEEFASSVDKKSLLFGYREAVSDDKGNFEVKLNFDGVSGIYEAYIGAEGEAELINEKIHYIFDEANGTALGELKGAMAEGEAAVKSIILSKYKELGMDVPLVEKTEEADILNAAKILLKSKSQGDISEPEKAAEYLDKALAVSLFNSGDIGVFGEFEALFITEDDMKGWVSKAFMDSEVKEFIEERTSKNSQSFADFDKTFTEAVALGIIYGADGHGTISSYLKKYADVLGIESSDVTSTYAQRVIGKKYNSLSETKLGSDKGSGGSGGGGGGGGFPPKNAAAGLTVGGFEETAVPMEKEDGNSKAFSDLSGFEWAEEAIAELKKAGIVSGRADGVFAPQDSVLREEFVKMILGAGKFEELYGDISFNDVNADDWFYPYIKNAYLCGIINGISETEFGSGNEISRQDMAVVCYNMLSRKGMLESTAELEALSYGDTGNISDYAVLAVRYLSDAGILNGDENNMFMPQKSLNRAEAAAVIYRTHLLIENK